MCNRKTKPKETPQEEGETGLIKETPGSYYFFHGMPNVVVWGDTPALKKLRQEIHGFSSGPNYTVRPLLKKCDYIFNSRKEKCIFWGGE